jgi:hypothetical protein
MTHIFATSFVMLIGVVAGAVEFAEDAAKSTPEQRLAFAKQAAAAYRFRVEGRGRPAVRLLPEPLLRWNNHVVREDDGMLFLWTEGDTGRPLATAQFFVVGDDWHHEFQSLSLSPFEARFEQPPADNWSWRPTGRPRVRRGRQHRCALQFGGRSAPTDEIDCRALYGGR